MILDGEKNTALAEKKKAFLQATIQGNLQRVKENFSKEIDINKRYQLGQTLLCFVQGVRRHC